ncbi:MAG TPA: acetyl-L-homoserine sulfhydrolase [Verrucomicrobia bacterium]|nr:MAG: acetyl-L-homoserine sulfhydrolase [Lentisphaerae bacterium GWF2_57_35]HBA83792.1 acetyl-L-homoserine sulfhydrolase [Verrucomicrobiota bacterium]
MHATEKPLHLETQLIHAASAPEQPSGATTTPVVQSTAFTYGSAEEIEAVFAGREAGYVYSRIANPTVAALEARLTALEGGLGALAVSSGMAAISSLVLALAGSGDEIVAGSSLFGGTYALFRHTLSRFGIRVRFVDPTQPDAFRDAIGDATRLVFVETIGNPKLDVPDIAAISAITRELGVPLAVDSTVTTPLLIQPKRLGADLIVHSTSKFINGHGNAIGGVIVDAGSFDWASPRFPHLAPYLAKVGRFALLAALRGRLYRDLGGCLAPFNAFLLSMGLESLGVRMERHCANAARVAAFLAAHPEEGTVVYPGLESHPDHALAQRQFGGRYGALVTFTRGTKERCFSFINRLKLAKNSANLGDTRTLVLHPASTIYRDLDREERWTMGVTDDLIRLAIGIENADDILGDVEQALGS